MTQKVKLTPMHPRQKAIASEILSSPAMYHIVCTSRQFGKSFMLEELLLIYAYGNPRWSCMFVSMTYPQVQKVMMDIYRVAKPTGIVESFSKSSNEIVLTNGSIIRFRSYQNPDSARGYSNHLLVIDECAFMSDNDFNEVYRPTLTVTGKRCILTSTPRGRNWFYDMYLLGEQHDPNYRSYTATYMDNPLANLEEVEDARRRLAPNIFQAEYEARFIDGSMSAFQGYRECINIPCKTGRIYAGLDIGRQNDYTVLTIMQGERVVYIGRWKEQTWEHIIGNVVDKLREFKVEAVWYEVNGLGDPVGEMFRKMAMQKGLPSTIRPWTTSNQSKTNIIEQLIADFQRKTISIPDDKDLLLELDNFEASYSTQSRCIKYEARIGMHDDMVMSCAIVNYNRNIHKNLGTFIV